MQIKDVFPEIRTGVNLNRISMKGNDAEEIYTFQKDAIQYSRLVENKLNKIAFNGNIDDKYLMQPRDIIISLKKPFKAGTFLKKTDKKILIPTNFVVLRNINMDKYSFIFVANYLERIGLNKFVKENNIKNELTIEDIKKIELPDILKEEQTKISSLMNNINERSILYNDLLENDEKIIKYALNLIIGDNNV